MFSSSISSMQNPYQAVVVEGKWGALEEFFNKDEAIYNILYPTLMTVAKDSAFHIAVHSKSKKPLKQLLDRFANYDEQILTNILNTTNAYENTVLHEAAINHNIAAVKLLVEGNYVTPQHLLDRNESGHTPLFKAAAFGSTKVVKYLASRPLQMTESNTKLKDAHRINNDGFSILHAAVQGEHFGTALELLKLDQGLAELKTKNGMTSLHLLINLRSAFSNKFCDHLWDRLLYYCIPTGDDNYDDANYIFDKMVDQNDGEVSDEVDQNDGEVSDEVDQNPSPQRKISKGLEIINKSFWNYFIKENRWPSVGQIWIEKKKLNFAFKLARKLIKDDHSWEKSYTQDTIKDYRASPSDKQSTNVTGHMIDEGQSETAEDKHQVETPLLAATRTGVIELVKEILKIHPQAVEHVSHKKQNILHVATSYRKREIFDLVIKMDIPRRRLILGIDEEGYTVLHHVADNTNCTGGTGAGPAYKLQEELERFQRVEKIMPWYFTQHLENKTNKTAKELFIEMHQKQLEDAQKSIKETSQSCSGVAVLVATVVFAAAFTVPGGNDENKGFPLLLHSPFFKSFTLMDVVSLSCSLTSVVMFLSVIISPFELENFRVSLPRRLTLGFALLFMSVATTMLTFTSTVILIIQSDHRQQWTLTLICCAAFFPVSVLALTHFPLFPEFIRAWNNIFKFIWNALNACYSFLRPLGFCFLACCDFLIPLVLCFLIAFSCIFLWPLKHCFLACCSLFKFLRSVCQQAPPSKDHGNV